MIEKSRISGSVIAQYGTVMYIQRRKNSLWIGQKLLFFMDGVVKIERLANRSYPLASWFDRC